MRILAGDLGGTTTVLGVYAVTGAGLTPIAERTFPSQRYDTFEQILDELARDPAMTGCDHARFAVAGPVVGQRVQLTNLPWTLDTRELAERLGARTVTLINDVRAAAYGMLMLPADAFEIVHAGADRGPGTIAVIAPGTGLGQAVLYWDGARYHAIPSEGGHADLAASTDEEIELLRALRLRHGHVSYERVLSGSGISAIYDHLRSLAEPEAPEVAARLGQGDRNAAITQLALEEADRVCVEALDMFCALLGAAAANLVLYSVATGGVIIGGGIAPKIMPALRRGGLVTRFTTKGRFSAWLEQCPVRVALDERAPLVGAAHWPDAAVALPELRAPA